MAPILDKQYSLQIYKTSYLCFLTHLYAVYKGHYGISIIPLSVGITSLHYWKNPDYSYRRYLDIIVVKTGLTYQLYIAYFIKHGELYYYIMSSIPFLYFIGIYYHRQKNFAISTYAHILLHIVANIGNVVLYTLIK